MGFLFHMTYSEKLQSPEWQKKKTEIQIRDKFTCQCCGDTKTQLQVHHKAYIKGLDPWDYPDDNFILLCKHCHHFESKIKFGIPKKCLKIMSNDEHFRIVAFYDDALVLYASNLEQSIAIKSDQLKTIVHFIINTWLEDENLHFLTSKEFNHE